jgi:hypothetical protein
MKERTRSCTSCKKGETSLGEERQWYIGELIGVLADYNPLSDPEEAGDKVLADCLLCAWEESTGGNCH